MIDNMRREEAVMQKAVGTYKVNKGHHICEEWSMVVNIMSYRKGEPVNAMGWPKNSDYKLRTKCAQCGKYLDR